MSQAFVREGDDQSLSEIPPTMQALVNLLTRENGGIRVHERARLTLSDGRDAHKMSNGLTYAKRSDGPWEIVA